MNKRMTEAHWTAVISATQRGIDEMHDAEHNAEHEGQYECAQCREAYEGLTILKYRYYEKYLKKRI